MGYRFNRLELSGSLGDLGTLLPLSIGMILINGVSPLGLFLSVGLFYILSGSYYGVPTSVQPMKVIGAYAVVMGISAPQIMASGLLMAAMLLIMGGTGAITHIARYVPKSVIRGVQLSTGVLLMAEGVRFIMGTSKFQVLQESAEPYLTIQNFGPVPMGVLLGVICGLLALILLHNKKLPAVLVVLFIGLCVGIFMGRHQGLENLRPGIHIPALLPFGIPATVDFGVALFVLALPQLPMTIFNAVLANSDLSRQYFGEDAKRVTNRALCISMVGGNLMSFLVGGMPLCHGAGGLAAHYRFGARTAGSNLMVGAIFIILAVFLGSNVLAVLHLIPLSVLGVLLLFTGSELALTISDITGRRDISVLLVMLGITLASNLAIGFIVGIALAYLLKSERISV
jgi:SulP family sulfate permease